MRSFQSFVLFSSAVAFYWGVNVSAQIVPAQSPQAVQPRIQLSPIQQEAVQQPIKSPLFGTQSTSVYQRDPNLCPPTTQFAVQQMPIDAPIRVATTNPAYPATSVPAEQPQMLYDPAGANRIPQNTQFVVASEHPQGMVHMGRAEPAGKIVPFFLSPVEQQQLDEFLARWERNSVSIKRYDVEFYVLLYDSTIPGAEPNKPHKVAYGYFKYIANPMRFVYVVEGEWQNGKRIKREGDKNPHIHAEKTIIDEKTVFRYDYNSKTMYQINVPPEMIGKGIADSPLPLIFGAKADELKRRFSMKIENAPGQDNLIWLRARPLLIEDQQEFKELEILLEKRTLMAQGLKQWDINDKAYKVFQLTSTKVNDRLLAVVEDLKTWFTPTIERGWKHEMADWVLQPPPSAAVPQPQIGNALPPQQGEVPLYRVQ